MDETLGREQLAGSISEAHHRAGEARIVQHHHCARGLTEGDLRLRLMQLKFYLRAVTNSILDYNMHCTRMSDEEGMRFLMDVAFQSEGEAKLKLIRAKQSSVQLSTYFVGRMAHYRLRQQLQREMGKNFDLGRYHEAVLSCGSVSPKYLPELVRRRLAEPR